jgi:hypothetical protein
MAELVDALDLGSIYCEFKSRYPNLCSFPPLIKGGFKGGLYVVINITSLILAPSEREDRGLTHAS